MSKAKAWFLLFRPWSYTATLVPFLVAAGFLWGGNVDWRSWALGLFAGLCLQATVNLLNTWGDERSGVDDAPGAIRTTPQVHDGIISMRAVLIAAIAAAVVGVAAGAAACVYTAANTSEKVSLGGGWFLNVPALAAGVLGILGATNYSTGIKFKYHGLGVPFVSMLMGPIEMFAALALFCPVITAEMFYGETHVEQFLVMPGLCYAILALYLFASLPVASLVGVIMHGNDMRDISSDRAAGIVTLASRLGPRGALWYYCAAHVVPYATVALFAVLFLVTNGRFGGAGFLLPLLCLPLSVRTIRTAVRVYRERPESPPWRGLERASGLVHFIFGLLYAAAWALKH